MFLAEQVGASGWSKRVAIKRLQPQLRGAPTSSARSSPATIGARRPPQPGRGARPVDDGDAVLEHVDGADLARV